MEALQSREAAEESVHALAQQLDDLRAESRRHEAEWRRAQTALAEEERQGRDLHAVLKRVKVRLRVVGGGGNRTGQARGEEASWKGIRACSRVVTPFR